MAKQKPVSREYVLERLDKWYFERYKRVTTLKDIERFHEGLDKILSECPSLPEAEKKQFIETAKTVSDVNLTYFSSMYAMFEAASEGIPSMVCAGVEDLPIEMRDNYFKSFEEAQKLMKGFVDEVRKSATQDITKELSDKVINEVYRRTLKNSAGMQEYLDRLERASRIFFYSTLAADATAEEKRAFMNYLDFAARFAKEINARMFADFD